MTPDYIHHVQHLREELASLKSAYERNRDALQCDLDYMLRSCDHRRADGTSAVNGVCSICKEEPE